MPKDEDSGGQYPRVLDYLTHNPWPKPKETKTKKKKGAKKGAKRAATKTTDKIEKFPLVQNKNLTYKPKDFGNYPTRKDGKPRAGLYRMVLPADADWKWIIKKKVEEDEDSDK